MPEPETYWAPAQQPATGDVSKIIGTRCVNCGVILTAENLGAITDKVGVCSTCRPPSAPPPAPGVE